jgi:hypothetical protein
MQWKTDLSLGNVLTMATIVVGLAIGWQTIVGNVNAASGEVRRLDQRMDQFEGRFNTLLDTLARERVSQTQILTELSADLRYLRQSVEKVQGE